MSNDIPIEQLVVVNDKERFASKIHAEKTTL